MEDSFDRDKGEVFSKRVKAGKRTYFFDVKSTRSNDYYLTITESKRKNRDDGVSYEKHKIFLYKEDFDKFENALTQTLDHIKNELLNGYQPPAEEDSSESSPSVDDDAESASWSQ